MTENSKLNVKIALIFGGRGVEHQISCLSAARILRLIKTSFVKPVCIYIAEGGGWYFFPPSEELIASAKEINISGLTPTYPVLIGRKCGFLKDGEILEVDCCIPALHGDFGEDGRVQGALECAKIPFVGQGVASGALCADKEYTKLVAISAGIPTLPYAVYRESRYSDSAAKAVLDEAKSKFGYPMFIKPAGLGSSYGASPVNSDAEFFAALKSASELCCGKVLIEKLVRADYELECAFLDGEERLVTEPSAVSVGGFYDFKKKYIDKNAEASVPADIDNGLRAKAVEYSKRLCELLSLRDLARIDFFLVGGKLYFNEVNTFPGFTSDSLYEKMLTNAGIESSEIIKRLVALAILRKDAQS